MSTLLIFFIRLYQYTLSPFLHTACGPSFGCRFSPTCSEYAIAAIRTEGTARGGIKAAKRLTRCQPFSS